MDDDNRGDIVENREPRGTFGLSDLERAFRSMMRYPWEWTRRFEEGFRTPLSEMRIDDKTGDIMVALEIPGVSKEEIEITVSNTELTVVAESENRKYKRSFSVSKRLDPMKTKASLNNGVLEIRLRTIKTEEVRRHRVKID